jgi:hypothetical protein
MKATHRVWYVKRQDVVTGPFPAKFLSRQILVGRLAPTDLVSADGVQWCYVSDAPELLPPQLAAANADDPVAQQRLLAAQRWEDERSGKDRRGGPAYGGGRADAQRQGRERRRAETPAEVDHRGTRGERLEEVTEGWREAEHREARRQALQTWSVGLVVSVVMVLAYLFVPRPPAVPDPECAAAPRPGINWSNCRLDGATLDGVALGEAYMPNVYLTRAHLAGAVLAGAQAPYANFTLADLRGADFTAAELIGASFRGADLRRAKLRGANLAYADFSGARLDESVLDDATLDKAIWPDGRVCGPRSRGRCEPVDR